MATALASISITHGTPYDHQQAKSAVSALLTSNTLSTTTSTIAAKPAEKGSDKLRVVGIHEYKEAAACLADAFKDDHTTHYFLDTPDSTLTEAEKWDVHVSMMEYITYAHCMKGLVTTIGPNYDAVALWYGIPFPTDYT
jgi:hypothetical protein